MCAESECAAADDSPKLPMRLVVWVLSVEPFFPFSVVLACWPLDVGGIINFCGRRGRCLGWPDLCGLGCGTGVWLIYLVFLEFKTFCFAEALLVTDQPLSKISNFIRTICFCFQEVVCIL